jgi:arylsulfatase A-like enzyme
MRIWLTLVVLLALPRGAWAEDRPPNVLLVVADDLRADVTSVYGGPVKTPNLEALAARGSVFDRATCGYPICHVSRAELITGRCLVTEASTGRLVHLRPEWGLWPEVMRQAGWHTVYSGKWHVEGTPWTRGYETTSRLFSAGGARGRPITLERSATGRPVTGYVGWTFKTNENTPLPELGVGLTPETDARIADGAIDAIRAEGSNRPLFLHVNFTAPHDPLHWPAGLEDRYRASGLKLPANFRPEHPFDHGNINGRDEVIVPAPRSEADVRAERAVYYALVENLDTQLGRILKALSDRGELGRTIVVFTSDQGLAIGSHGLMGKQNNYEHTAQVPLVLAGPGIPAGKRFAAQCALRDLYPTICELTGQPVPKSVEGKSLVPVLNGRLAEVHDAVFGYFTDTQRMIRTPDGWKLIWYPKAGRTQLFHVVHDPDEWKDLSEDPVYEDRMREMMRSLRAWLREHGDPLGQE